MGFNHVGARPGLHQVDLCTRIRVGVGGDDPTGIAVGGRQSWPWDCRSDLGSTVGKSAKNLGLGGGHTHASVNVLRDQISIIFERNGVAILGFRGRKRFIALPLQYHHAPFFTRDVGAQAPVGVGRIQEMTAQGCGVAG